MRTLRISSTAALALWLTIAIPIAWAAPQSKSTSTVHVRQYTRKDGTVVAAHERSAPGSASAKTGSNTGLPAVGPSTTRTPPAATPTGQTTTPVNPNPTKSTQPSRISPAQQGTPSIHVRQYTSKDGLVVAGHERSAPASPPSKTTRPGSAVPKANAASATSVASPRSASATGTQTPRTTTNGQPVFEGPRGGEYHYSASGKKVYTKKKE